MNSEGIFFDAYSIFDPSNAGILPLNASGVLTFGHAENAPRTENCFRAERLGCIVGANDPRFPRTADVVDLVIDDAALVLHLKEPPAHWWPLCGTARDDGWPVILHINAVDCSSLAKGLTRLARAFPSIRIVLDPFVGGKNSKWLAGVCLAEETNIWISGRGLYAAETLWPERSEREALHFTVGEVGAGKLLFASGMTAAQLNAQPLSPMDWLASIPFLDAAQHRLILRKNAAEVFAVAHD